MWRFEEPFQPCQLVQHNTVQPLTLDSEFQDNTTTCRENLFGVRFWGATTPDFFLQLFSTPTRYTKEKLIRTCSAMMTCSKKWRLALMYLASVRIVPSMPVLPTRSLPAKSTRWNLLRRTTESPGLRASRCMVNTQWEREEAMFIGVSAIMRFVSPRNSRFKASSAVSALHEPQDW